MALRDFPRRLLAMLLLGAALAGAPRSAEAWVDTQTVCTFLPDLQVRLVAGSDGNLYGTTKNGGLSGVGQIVKIVPGGSATTLASFSWSDGGYPLAALIEGVDGNFYGTTSAGGANGMGTVFSVTTGGTLTALASFDGTNGAAPQAPLIEPEAGVFYGVCNYGGASGVGTVFRIAITAGTPSTLLEVASFNGSNGANPNTLVSAGGGLYGTTIAGGGENLGTIFKLNSANGSKGEINLLISAGPTDLARPTALILGKDGNLYGTSSDASPHSDTPLYNGSIFKLGISGKLKLTVLGYFYAETSGTLPNSLVQAADGNLYGTTGAGTQGYNQDGTVFECVVTGDTGSISGLAGFSGDYLPGPIGLIFDSSSGIFYGGVGGGGSAGQEFSYSLTNGFADGATVPNVTSLNLIDAKIIDGGNGSLYGIAPYDGIRAAGTIFRILPSGATVTLVHFDGTNGATPSSLLLGQDGAIYGTTSAGGANGTANGDGTMFHMDLDGTLTTLVSFDGTNTGAGPCALIQTDDGVFFGTASTGGAIGDGTLFQATVAGTSATVSPILSFAGANGSGPNSLLQARDGSFYGTTSGGGADGYGTIFQLGASLDPSTFQSLISFTGTEGGAPGQSPIGPLLEAHDGHFYGVTQQGGASSFGTFYQLSGSGANTTLNSLVPLGFIDEPGPGNLLEAADGTLYGASYISGLYSVTVSGTTGTYTELTIGLNQEFSDNFSAVIRGSDGIFYLLSNFDLTSVMLGNPDGGALSATKSSFFDGCMVSLLPSGPGVISLSSSSRAYSGVVTLPEGRHAFAGDYLSGYGTYAILSYNRPNDLPMTLTLEVNDDGTAFVFAHDERVRYQGVPRENQAFTAKAPPSEAGRYTLVLAPSDSAGTPVPDVLQGYGVMDVTAAGAATLSGKLSDGTAFSASARVRGDGTIAFFDPLYNSLGGVGGTITFETNTGVSDCDGVLQWVRPAQTGRTSITALSTNVQFLGSKYSPANLAASATLTLVENTQTSVMRSLAISTAGKVTVTNPGADKTAVTLDRITGAFSGTFTDPGSGKKGSFGGVIYQDEGIGVGELDVGGALGVVGLSFP